MDLVYGFAWMEYNVITDIKTLKAEINKLIRNE